MSLHTVDSPVRDQQGVPRHTYFSSKNTDLFLPQVEDFLDYFPSEAPPWAAIPERVWPWASDPSGLVMARCSRPFRGHRLRGGAMA